MVKLILNKKYKQYEPGDIFDATLKEQERLINKGMAHYPEKPIKPIVVIKPKKPKKPRKKKSEKFNW